MKKILHIVNPDKFTAGYINYMKINFKEYNHFFLIKKSDYTYKFIDEENIEIIDNYSKIFTSFKIRKRLNKCNQIIVSGIFNIDLVLTLLPNKILKKCSLQFWGGDFYQFNEGDLKKQFHKVIMKSLIMRVNRCIFLIDGESEKFKKIMNLNNPIEFDVAPMPEDPLQIIDYDNIIKKNLGVKHRVLVGNSATRSNNHIEVLHFLENAKEVFHDLTIICPLSYGDKDYRKEVINYGKRTFDDSFIPILELMNYEDYCYLLSTCSVAIFNNNRQQGMGNITNSLYLGKKVYLKSNTTMWNVYRKRGFFLNELKIDDFDEISSLFDNLEEISKFNIKVGKKQRLLFENNCKNQWSKILK